MDSNGAQPTGIDRAEQPRKAGRSTCSQHQDTPVNDRLATGTPGVPHHSDLPLDHLLAVKAGRSISVCVPARNEARTIGPIVSTISSQLAGPDGLVDEIVVVDDGSTDTTGAVAREAGARVVPVRDAPASGSPSGGAGKGAAMWTAVLESRGDIIVFCDADIVNFDARFVTGLAGPLLVDDGIALVKGSYRRPIGDDPTGGGRVTELVARPLIRLFFPELAFVHQPLAGETAAVRHALEKVPFSPGYGVEIALLIDVARRFGTASIAQVDLDVRAHRNRPLEELSPQAAEVMLAALSRCPLLESPIQEEQLPPLLDFYGSPGRQVTAR